MDKFAENPTKKFVVPTLQKACYVKDRITTCASLIASSSSTEITLSFVMLHLGIRTLPEIFYHVFPALASREHIVL